MTAHIFISYTARDETSKRISGALYKHLQGAQDVEPWLDRERLVQGEKWHDALMQNLVGSHGGVLLLTKEALKSKFVLKEATYLKVRSDVHPHYKLLCFLLDGLAPADIRASAFSELKIEEDQLASCPESELPALALKGLGGVVDLWRDPPPEERLIQDIEWKLRACDKVDGELLLRIARSLMLNLFDWFPDTDITKTLARALAHLMAHSELGDVVKALRAAFPHIDQGAAESILECLAPLQIDFKAAARLRDLAEGMPPRAAAGLNARQAVTGLLYVRRASGGLARWRHVEVTSVRDPDTEPEDLLGQVRLALARKRKLDDPEELDKELPYMDPPYVVFIPSAVSTSGIEKLKSQLGQFCYFLLSDKLSPQSRICRDKVVEFLEPGLGKGEEEELSRRINAAKKDVAELFE